MKKAILSLGSILILSALAASAQGLGPMSADVGHAYGTTTETETKQTLSEGTHIVSKTISRFYQDSLGRTRSEIFPDSTQRTEVKDQPIEVIIYDPVESVQYFLHPRNHTATLEPVELLSVSSPQSVRMPVDRAAPVAPPYPPPSIPSTVTEDLGMQIVQEVWARGTRVTTTYAADSIGNDQPIVTVSEVWYSEQLGIMVLMKESDPRTGETTQRVTVDTAVPDPALFRPPADYKIIQSEHTP